MAFGLNVQATSTLRYMGLTNNALAQTMRRISSGLRINSAADDPAGLAVSEKMRSQISGMNQAIANAEDGVSMLSTYEGALNETHAILNRMKTLATQSANGIYSNETDRAALQLEFSELIEELNDIAGTDFNGRTLLDGGAEGLDYNENLDLQVGARTKDLKSFDMGYEDAWQFMDDPDAARKKSIGELEADPNTTAEGLGFKDDKINISTQLDANLAIDQIDFAINKVSLVRAKLGAVENRLNHKINNLTETSLNLSEAESRIRDADLAEETLKLARLQILAQAQQYALRVIMEQQKGILGLLNNV
ncbi:MAG: flagellin [Ruminococcus sp.]|jgi:flagellin|nr:flagellin [Ruminococcus sp.]